MEIELEAVDVQRYVRGKWRKEVGTWVIRDADHKLRAKYSRGTTLLFDWYVFHSPANDPDRITHVDLTAPDALMSANISAQKERWEALFRRAQTARFRRLLGSVPRDATLLEPLHHPAAVRLIDALMGDGVKLAIATKVLTVKRPHLIPMLDSVVQACFASSDPAALLERMRRALVAPCARATVSKLAALVRREFGVRPSPARILEQLVWFDWNLVPGARQPFVVRGFPEWSYDPDRHVEGIVRRVATGPARPPRSLLAAGSG